MSHFQDGRAEFVLAGSPLQRLGAFEGPAMPQTDVVSLNAHVMRFGIFELDAQTLELRRQGRLIHLRHQPARVLTMLLERAGRLVSRDEITNELWASDIDVDVEQGLNHCVKEIRAALGDWPEAPRYIQTLPRRGYRMLMEVQTTRETRGQGETEAASAPPPQPPSAPESTPGVHITISVARSRDHTLLWSGTYERAVDDLRKIERDLQDAFASGIRPALEAETLSPVERDDEDGGPTPSSRRGFE